MQITFEELKRKIQPCDLYYSFNKFYPEHIGWRMYCGNGYNVGLNTKCSGSWGDSIDEEHINVTKVIFFKDIKYQNKYSEFIKTCDESLLYDCIVKVAQTNPKEQELQNLIEKLTLQLENAQNELEIIKNK